ncbi:hypothetical protein WSS_A21184 [Rhodococcus opacus M213]|uniref:ABM domain-containing protein n=1 Tax=Rhodococcus opacus M213 TaxID=1129896 RepID=K8XG62_RHOOP|nr:hypothetical protein WSS_A21184 [Rhodococcus opacus M213]
MTTSVSRRVAAGREQEFLRWTDAGMAMAGTFPGFLGGGWLRAASDPEQYHVVYRFADEDTLDAWTTSPARKVWVGRGTGLAQDTVTHRLTGGGGLVRTAVDADARRAGHAATAEVEAGGHHLARLLPDLTPHRVVRHPSAHGPGRRDPHPGGVGGHDSGDGLRGSAVPDGQVAALAARLIGPRSRLGPTCVRPNRKGPRGACHLP